jgi:hypothetical protein
VDSLVPLFVFVGLVAGRTVSAGFVAGRVLLDGRPEEDDELPGLPDSLGLPEPELFEFPGRFEPPGLLGWFGLLLGRPT